jgi:hypothetical protein
MTFFGVIKLILLAVPLLIWFLGITKASDDYAKSTLGCFFFVMISFAVLERFSGFVGINEDVLSLVIWYLAFYMFIDEFRRFSHDVFKRFANK